MLRFLICLVLFIVVLFVGAVITEYTDKNKKF